VARLKGGFFLGAREQPSLPDLAAYPQFALYSCIGFWGATDILESEEMMAWLARMKEFVSGGPTLIPEKVCRQSGSGVSV
jgi:hypothetical protein